MLSMRKELIFILLNYVEELEEISWFGEKEGILHKASSDNSFVFCVSLCPTNWVNTDFLKFMETSNKNVYSEAVLAYFSLFSLKIKGLHYINWSLRPTTLTVTEKNYNWISTLWVISCVAGHILHLQV